MGRGSPMNHVKRVRGSLAVRARRAAAATMAILLPSAASALTIINDASGSIEISLYNQDDQARLIPCHNAVLSAGASTQSPGFPGICGSYAKLKIEAVGRAQQGVGGTCRGDNISPDATVRIAGTIDACGVSVAN